MTATNGRRPRAGLRTDRDRLDARHGYEDDRSMGEIVGDLLSHGQQLLRGELAFAKRELADNARQIGGAAGIGAAAVPFVLAGVGLLGIALGFGLAEAMPLWAGFLIAGLVYLVIAAIAGLVARSRVKDAQLTPVNSIEQAQEDLTWIKAHRG